MSNQGPYNTQDNKGFPRITDAVNRQSRLPLHQQIYEILRGSITQGTWQVDELIPTELELMDRYQVSRATIRQVMDRLVSEGLVYRQQGRGTFISKPTLEEGLTRIISFTEDMSRRGLTPATRILASEIRTATEEIGKVLNVPAGTEVVYLKRLRMANGEPMCIEESYLVHELCPGILDNDFSSQPLRQTLETRYCIRIVRALQKIHAIVADAKTCSLLGTGSPSAVLFIERTSHNEWDKPVEFLRLYFRGDRYSLYNELKD